MDNLDKLKRRVLSKGKEFNLDRDIPFLHHKMMMHYGWIPLDEFRKLPLPTFWNLLDEINKMEEAEREAMKKK